ncbi:MAG: subclass B3 metallo-beta-lactamase [Gemmatimonadaceae bacterium]|nr:subclass B3 metallo-beta-lactamase [Gemmatimonadaceae bacterium]
MILRTGLALAALAVSGGAPLFGNSLHAAPTRGRDATCINDSSWIAPQAPFRIFGNTWHVGPRGLGVFLITSPTGHVLIDGGVPGHSALIEANIRQLGFALRDVKWILLSHAHCDHAGGIADLVRATGAQVIAGAADARALARGGLDDPHYGERFPFPPVRGVRIATHGEALRLGELTLVAHATPGHTAGNMTWSWQSCEEARCLQLVDVGSLSAPDYRLVGNRKAPNIVAEYTRGFAIVASLRCDIALAPHPGMVDFWERVARREQGDADALVDAGLCRAYAKGARENFERELATQRGAARGKRQK